MVDLSVRTLEQIVSEQAVAAQAEAPNRDLDFRPGSVFLALAEGFGTIGLWLQGLVLRVLAFSRASTSRAEDLDSWVGDYSLTRSPAASARGVATFSRFTNTISALIPAGTIVRTSDGVWAYEVIRDTTIGSWSEDNGGYLLTAGSPSISLPVAATAAGLGGNAATGTVTLMATAIPGIDTVTNAAPFSGGAEAESDDALRARFRLFLASLSRATRAAIDYAVMQVQAGLSWTVLENQTPNGSAAEASMTILVDDGTGTPSNELLSRVSAAVELVRPLGVSYYVIAPVKLSVDVSMSLSLAVGTDRQTVVGAVQDAIVAYINALPLGAMLSYSRILVVAYETSTSILNVQNARVNASTDDISADPRRVLRAGIISVS